MFGKKDKTNGEKEKQELPVEEKSQKKKQEQNDKPEKGKEKEKKNGPRKGECPSGARAGDFIAFGTDEWILKYYKILFLAFTGAIILLAFLLFKNYGTINALTEENKNLSQQLATRLVVVTNEGQIAVIKTKTLSPLVAQKILNNFIYNYMDFCVNTLLPTNPQTGQWVYPQNFKEFWEKSPLIQKWLKTGVLTEEGLPDFQKIMTFLWGEIVSGNLPEYVFILKVEPAQENGFSFKDGKFVYNAKVLLATRYFDIYRRKWLPGKGTGSFILQGYIDFSKANTNNPNGVFITGIKEFQWVSKPANSQS